ncbi:MAG: transporter substrate-binding domain-containing protein [Desulfobacterales bacterium]|nr:transporter substrate-binding domain-containing protein [Desulfobacterales bacterium]
MFKKIVFTTIFIMMTYTVSPHAEEIWKITSLNWEPYSGAEMTTQGNSVQKLRELLKKEGIRLIVEFYPWKRAQHKAKEKEYVGYFPAWPEEVAEGFTASPPVDWSEVGILKNSGSSVSFKSIDDLFKKYRVGIVKTYVYPALITDAMKKYPEHADGAPDELSLLKKLSKGRHSVAITDPNVMMYLAGKNGIDNVEPAEVIMKKELVLAFRNDEDNRSRIDLLKKLLKEK